MRRKAETPTRTERTPIARADLEQAIAEVVRASSPDCQSFVGVILQVMSPASPEDPNWMVKGVRYGKADRALCDTALSHSVAEKQNEFDVSDPVG
jgi:hypothetical protein